MAPHVIDLSVVIVSYNTREMTLRCLADLTRDLAASGLASEVIVVDNASTDGSADAVAKAHREVILIRFDRNLGFGAANNRAFEIARGKFIMLLNSDAFVHLGACARLVSFLRDRPTCAVAGPRLEYEDGSMQRSAWPFPSPWRCVLDAVFITSLLRNHSTLGDLRSWSHDDDRSVPWLIGACLVVRRSTIERVGGFDPQFFMYAEETDWQKRIRDDASTQCRDVRLCPRAVVTHVAGGSRRNEAAKVNRMFYESQDRYYLKHFGWSGLFLARMASAIGSALRALAWLFALAFTSIVRPAKRSLARAKLALMASLAWRQATHWPVAALRRRVAP